MDELSFTFLGTATSVGVPMIGCSCATCCSSNPKDKRLRCAGFLKSAEGSWLIDCGPDLRQQCLTYGITTIDGLLITHPHSDHIMGFDELRRFTIDEKFLPVHASTSCLNAVRRAFSYAFDPINHVRGYIKPLPIPFDGPFFIHNTLVTPLPCIHGNVETHGFLFTRNGEKKIAYFPDCKTMPDTTIHAIKGVHTLILDSLRRSPHPTHLNLEESIALVKLIAPQRAFFTHFLCEVSHQQMLEELAPIAKPAYDGLTIFV